MAMIDTAHKAPFGAITTFRATTVLSNVTETVKTWITDRIDAARTADALSRLSPTMLDDIGMTPSDVARIRSNASLL